MSDGRNRLRNLSGGAAYGISCFGFSADNSRGATAPDMTSVSSKRLL